MAARVLGTFTGTGQSAPVTGSLIDIAISFGSGSVDVERLMPDGSTWIKLETAITANFNKIAEYPAEVNLRLNCTSYTSAITYILRSRPTVTS